MRLLSEIGLWHYCMVRSFHLIVYVLQRIKRLVSGCKPYMEEDVRNKVVVITGASSGIGKQCVYEMVRRGAAKVILACRNIEAGQKTIEEIQSRTNSINTAMEVMKLDLASLESIRNYAAEFKRKCQRLDILINNAGFCDPSGVHKTTKDGFEHHFGVNYLGHFYLTNLLLDTLRRHESSSRVITVSSHIAVLQNLNLDDVMMENSSYGPFNWMPYANSKFANALFAMELAKREGANGIRSYSVTPGLVSTNFFTLTPKIFSWGAKYFGESIEQACETIIYLALAKEVDNEQSNGRLYHFQCSFGSMIKRLNSNIGKGLWQLSENLVGLRPGKIKL